MRTSVYELATPAPTPLVTSTATEEPVAATPTPRGHSGDVDRRSHADSDAVNDAGDDRVRPDADADSLTHDEHNAGAHAADRGAAQDKPGASARARPST